MKAYLPSVFMTLLAFLFFAFPELAAVLLGGALLSIAIVYTWFTFRYQKYVKNMTRFKTTPFEEEIFRNGAPTFKTISVRVFKF